MYTSKDVVDKWFVGWHFEGNKLLKWNIFNYLYDEECEVVIVTWILVCNYQFKEYTFEGSSIIEFKDNLIVKYDEYQMEANKKHPYGK